MCSDKCVLRLHGIDSLPAEMSSEVGSSSRGGHLDHSGLTITDPVASEDTSRWVNAVKEEEVDTGDDVELGNEENQEHAPREKEVSIT